MTDAIAETAPKRDYHEVEGRDDARFYFRCHCGQVIKRRRDSFVPGLHVVICLACNNFSTTIVMLNGKEMEQKASDHKQPTDLGASLKPAA